MENLSLSESFPTCDLPEDLYPLILCFLPVIALLRFRAVSKSWRSLIDDPNFALSHLSLFNYNLNESHLLVADATKMRISGLGVVHKCVVRCSETFRTTAKLGFLQSDLDSPETLTSYPECRVDVHMWNVVSSINGLFMLRSWSDVLMLWNPSIRKTLILPPSPEVISQEATINVELGLGFDPLSKDYKHVRVVLSHTDEVHSVAVYTVRTNSWKAIEFRSEEGISSIWGSDFGIRPRSVCIRGVLYFLSRHRNLIPFKLISFDLSNEVFSSIRLPISVTTRDYVPLSHLYYQSLTMSDGASSLALVHFTPPNGCIWVLESSGDDAKSLSWTKLCIFDTAFPLGDFRDRKFMPLYLTKYWELLLKRRSCVKSYDIVTGKEKELLKKKKGVHQDNIWLCKENLYRFN